MGICDDWSYVRSAQLLAQTGHLVYNGWATAIVGWQLYLGAAFIKLLGFSFTAPRLGTLLIALVTAYLMQRTLVRFGISDSNAVLGTLTFVLSPLFMQLSATMMTDVPGFFSMLACIYSCVRALQAQRDRDSILWLCLAVAVNALCGTSRQIAWLGVLVLVPSTLWLLRSRRKVFLCGIAITALGYVFVFATLYWFKNQPYALLEPLSLAPLHLWAWKAAGPPYVSSIVAIGLLLFPLSVPYIAMALRGSPRNLIGVVVLAFFFFFGVVCCFGKTVGLRSVSYPFIGDWTGPRALYEGSGLVSRPPVLLNFSALHLLSAIALFAIFCIGATIWVARPTAINPKEVNTLNWYQLAIFFGPVTLVYLLLLSQRALFMLLDRYLLLPIFVALACLLLYSQQHLSVRWPAVTYIALAAIAFYGIISTHNTFAMDRARIALANEMFASGVQPSQVDLGMEMNSWYELQLSTYVNDYRILHPTGAYHPYVAPNRTGCHELTPYGFLPHLAPKYGIAFQPNLCDGPAPFAPVAYSTWPLLHPTTLYVVKYPSPWRSAIDVESDTRPATVR